MERNGNAKWKSLCTISSCERKRRIMKNQGYCIYSTISPQNLHRLSISDGNVEAEAPTRWQCNHIHEPLNFLVIVNKKYLLVYHHFILHFSQASRTRALFQTTKKMVHPLVLRRCLLCTCICLFFLSFFDYLNGEFFVFFSLFPHLSMSTCTYIFYQSDKNHCCAVNYRKDLPAAFKNVYKPSWEKNNIKRR